MDPTEQAETYLHGTKADVSIQVEFDWDMYSFGVLHFDSDSE